MKRIVALILTLVLVITSAVALGEQVGPTIAEHVTRGTKMERLTEEPVTLTMWIDMTSHDVTDVVGDFQNMDILKAIEEKTGVRIELIVPPVGEAATNFSLMLTNRKYPDIIIGFDNMYSSGGDEAIEEGIILDLKDLVEQYMPNYQAARTASEYRMLNTITDEGTMPYICTLSYQDQSSITYGGPIIRQDVLDKLGLDMPVTFDDWHEYLTRAKDELGMTRGLGLANTGISKYNAFNAAFDFGMSDPAQGGVFYVKDGVVQYGPLSEGYKEYVTLMAQWYSEGLIDPDFTSTITFDDGVAMMSGNLCSATSEHSGVLDYVNSLGVAIDPDFKFVAAPTPVLNEGDQLHYGYIHGGAPITKSAAISTSCEDPVLAARLLDQLFTDEGFLLCNYGTEGKTYEIVDGVPVFTDLVTHNDKGTPTHMMTAYAAPISWPFVSVYGREDTDALAAYSEIWDSNNDYSYSFPSGVTLNAEEKEIYADYYGDIESYVQEMTVKFIMGLESIDQYDNFVQVLKDQGIEEVMSAYQAAYDRYMSR